MSLQEWLKRLGDAIDEISEYTAVECEIPRIPSGDSSGATVVYGEITGLDNIPANFDKSGLRELQKHLAGLVSRTISRFGGRIEQMEGMTILGVFSQGDEPDHAVNATSAATDFFESIQTLDPILSENNLKIGARIGIHTGTVIRRSEFEVITGEAVQIAARLRKQSEGSAIIISTTVQKNTGKQFSYAPCGELSLKGMDAALKMFQVLNRKTEMDHWEQMNRSAQTLFCGREYELEKIGDFYKKCLNSSTDNGSKKHILLGITGPAGIGKSRLISHFLEDLAGKNQEGETDRVECEQIMSNGASGYHRRAMGALIAMLLNRLRHPASTDEIKRRLDEMVSDLSRYSHNLKELQQIIPLFGYLLGIHYDDPRLKYLKSLALQTEIFIAFRILVEAIAQKLYQTSKLPLIMIWERYRKMDDPSQDALRFILKNARTPLPMMIMVVYRPGGKLPEMTQRYVDQEKLLLESLSYGEEKCMISNLLGGRPVSPMLESLFQIMGKGHPYHLEELVSLVRSKGIIEFTEDQWQLINENAGENLPQSLQGIVSARIELLDPIVLDILHYAAVIGPRFDFEMLRKIAHRVKGKHDINVILSNLVTFQFISPDGVSGDLGSNYRFSFRSSLIHTSVYKGISEPRKKMLHGLCGEMIQAQFKDRISRYYFDLAYHQAAAGDTDQALETHRLAAITAMQLHAGNIAVRIFTRALEILPKTDPRRNQFYRNRGDVFHAFGMADRAVDDYKSCLSLAMNEEDKEVQGVTFYKIGAVFEQLNRFDEAILCFRQAMTIFRDQGDTLLEAGAIRNIGLINGYRDEYEPALEILQQALALSREHRDKRGESQSMMAIGAVHQVQRRFADAYHWFWESLAAAREIGNPRWEAGLFGCIGSNHYIQGQFGKALQYFDQVLEAADRMGNRHLKVTAMTEKGRVLFCKGEFDTAAENFNQALKIVRENNYSFKAARLLMYLGFVQYYNNESVKSLANLEQARRLFKRFHLAQSDIFALSLMARVHRKNNDHIQADDLSCQAITEIEQLKLNENEVTLELSQIFFTHFLVLQEQHDPDRFKFLEKSYGILNRSLEDISDADGVKNLLRTPFNWPISEEWKKFKSNS